MTAPARRGGRLLVRTLSSAAAGGGCREVSSSAPTPPPPPSQPGPPPPPPLRLLSAYVASSLASYFSRSGASCPVGSGARLPLTSFSGKAAYEAAVARLYATQPPGAWLTPAELFSPHYGAAVAAFVLRHHEKTAPPGAPLHIVEVGAGRGTLARDVLNAVRESSSGGGGLYSRTRYVTLDVSPALAEEASATVREAGHGGGTFTQAVGDACEGPAWAAVAEALGGCGGGRPTVPPYVLLCEVLDNLPHDRVVRRRRAEEGGGGGGGKPSPSAWFQSMVGWAGPGSAAPPTEVLRPLADPVIRACLAAALEEGQEGGGGGAAPPPSPSIFARLADFALGTPPAPPALHPSTAPCLFLPTGCARLLEACTAAFPAHTVLAFDFDALPSTLPPTCWGAPVVSGPPSPGQPAVDYPDVLAPAFGTADIFFPTDFGLLARLARRVGSGNVTTTTAKTSAWLRAHAPPAVLAATTTASGWNPLLDDFVNTSALVIERRAPSVVV